MVKLYKAALDWWQVIVAFAGAAAMAFSLASSWVQSGAIQPDLFFVIGLFLFLFFGSVAIIKSIKKARESEKKLGNQPQPNAATTSKVNGSGQSNAAGRDLFVDNSQKFLTPYDEPKPPRQIELGINLQEKEFDNLPYIIIIVTNSEAENLYCRAEIPYIYDASGKNIKRDISQYANLFSWSGGTGTNNGVKEIPAGLDATINLVRRHYHYGLTFLFHENSDTHWNNPGTYKLHIVLKGKIGQSEFVAKKVTAEFEYVKESNGIANLRTYTGDLRLLNWTVS